VSEPSSTWKDRWRESGFFSCSLLLVFAVAVCVAVVLPLAIWLEGSQGGLALVAAALICLVSGLAALVVATLRVAGSQAIYSLLLAMAFRLFPPLAVCLVLALRDSGAEYIGFVCYLLVFYMVTLSVETYLSVRWIRSQAS
jgi:hypothetical protein